MSKYCFDEVSEKSLTATSKARDDVTQILKENGYEPIGFKCNYNNDLITAILSALDVSKNVLKKIKSLNENDIVVLQHPFNCYSNYLGYKIHKICKKKNIKSMVLIHDLDTLRYTNYHGFSKGKLYKAIFRDEISYLNQFSYIIVHNNEMKKYLIDSGLDESKLYCLQIFDYLIENANTVDVYDEELKKSYKKVTIAENLLQTKSKYVYLLNTLNTKSYTFELYGINYSGTSNEFIHYNGAFKPEELPNKIRTGFGLVWDGDSLEKCSGDLGNYLRYNNPHKLSSYVACGIPVIVWKEAAMADFVRDNKIGIVIDNLMELDKIFDNLTFNEYKKMKNNVSIIRNKVIYGKYLKNVVKRIESDM